MPPVTQRFYSGVDADRLFSDAATADVIVIGGGQAGPAACWALERADPTLTITLLEANAQLAGGASTASMENFRTAWVPQCIAQQTQRSLDVFRHADDTLGEGAADAINVRQRGYLWLAMDDAEAVALRASVDLLHRWGIHHARYLDADTLRREYPWLPPHVVAAKHDPQAGWLNSDALANRFARTTRHTRFALDTVAREIVVKGDRVQGVLTSRGFITAPTVVLAAGPHTRALGRTAGIDIPVVCIPRQSFLTPFRDALIPADAPVVISRRPYAHFRPEGEGLLFAWSYAWRGQEDGRPVTALTRPQWPIERLKDPRFPEATLTVLARQFRPADGTGFRDPRYLSRRIAHQIGYYVYRTGVTNAEGHVWRSERAIIDRWPDIEGLFLSTAHAGHGIMTAPAAAEILAALVVGREPALPLWRDFGLAAASVPYEEGGGL